MNTRLNDCTEPHDTDISRINLETAVTTESREQDVIQVTRRSPIWGSIVSAN